jgi:hypothetical protein
MAVPADALDERHHPEQMRVAERRRVAHVPPERARSVAAQDVGAPGGDVAHRHVPRDGLEPVGGPSQRGRDTIGVVDDLSERDALLAGEPGRQRVLLVRAKRRQPAVLDGRDHAAERLTDAAERRLVLDHGRHASTILKQLQLRPQFGPFVLRPRICVVLRTNRHRSLTMADDD